MAVLEFFPDAKQVSLIILDSDALLVLNLHLDVIDRIRRLGQCDHLAGESQVESTLLNVVF